MSLDARVVLNFTSIEKLVTGPVHDLSVGGVFVRTWQTRPVGTQVWIKLVVEDGSTTIETRGTVVREVSSQESRRSGSPAGIAIEFLQLDAETKQQLERLVTAVMEYSQNSS